MSDRPNTTLADTMEVRRAEEFVALAMTVSAERMQSLDPREPVTIVGIFTDPEHIERIEKALGKARRDAIQSQEVQMEGVVVYTYETLDNVLRCRAYTVNADGSPISQEQADAAATKLKEHDANLAVMILPAEALPA